MLSLVGIKEYFPSKGYFNKTTKNPIIENNFQFYPSHVSIFDNHSLN